MAKRDDPIFNIKLAAEVKKYPCIYDFKLPDYSKRDVAESAWEKVATALNDEVKNCKEKWRNLRTVFVRKLKPTSGRKYSKVYYMTEHMQFILPYIKGVKSVDIPDNVPSSPSVQDDDESSDVDEKPLLSNDSTAISSVEYFENSCPDEQVLYSSKSKKIKQNHAISLANQCYIDYTKSKKQNSQIEDPQREDYRKQFLLSMLPEVNQMTNNQMRKFKRKMLDAIDDILGETSSS